jgi:hypothetical protein
VLSLGEPPHHLLIKLHAETIWQADIQKWLEQRICRQRGVARAREQIAESEPPPSSGWRAGRPLSTSPGVGSAMTRKGVRTSDRAASLSFSHNAPLRTCAGSRAPQDSVRALA